MKTKQNLDLQLDDQIENKKQDTYTNKFGLRVKSISQINSVTSATFNHQNPILNIESNKHLRNLR
jgi:hypothetical protein